MKISMQRLILHLTDLINDIEDMEDEKELLDPLYLQLHQARFSLMQLVDTLEELENGKDES